MFYTAYLSSLSTDSDYCTSAPKLFGKLFKNTNLWNYKITNNVGGFPAQKNLCRTCHYELKSSKALWVQAHKALWSNCQQMQSSESGIFPCKKFELLLHSQEPLIVLTIGISLFGSTEAVKKAHAAERLLQTRDGHYLAKHEVYSIFHNIYKYCLWIKRKRITHTAYTLNHISPLLEGSGCARLLWQHPNQVRALVACPGYFSPTTTCPFQMLQCFTDEKQYKQYK